MDALVKDEVCKMTGKDSYEAGDLSVEIDARVKVAAARFAGKETYEVQRHTHSPHGTARTHPQADFPQAGDLTREISKRAKASAIEFTGRSDYSFGDVSRELNKRRAEWVTGYLGKEYAFGDLTTKLVSDFTGKDDYKAPMPVTSSISRASARPNGSLPGALRDRITPLRAGLLRRRGTCTLAPVRLAPPFVHAVRRPHEDRRQELHRQGRIRGFTQPAARPPTPHLFRSLLCDTRWRSSATFPRSSGR